jgi:dTDP-3-amino-3,4,6-trideoxy-alpha-D-glucose transaminase
MIRFLDLAPVYRQLQPDIDAALLRVARSGCYLLGPELEAFEAEFAAFCGAPHCVGVSNGLDALTLVLRAWDVGPGDEVIVPAHTFVATWLAVTHVGARPVPVEPLAGTYNLDPRAVEAAVTPRTRAVVPVHLYGHPADMDGVLEVARRHGLAVLEDAAQAHGARWRGRRAGTFGDAAAFSFYPAKNLGALGDGGAVVTSDRALAERVRSLRSYGSPLKYVHVEPGFNQRLSEVQAAVLRAKLPHLERWNAHRAAIAAAYAELLAGTSVAPPEVSECAAPSWHLYVLRVADRDALRISLLEMGVETLVHYPTPPHRQPCYAGDPWPALPVTERIAAEVLSLPIGPHLAPPDVERVVQALAEAAARPVGA